MKTNVEIIRDLFEEVVNQKKIERWDHYFSSEYLAHGAPFIGFGFVRDTAQKIHKIIFVIPDSPADGKLHQGDELLWVEDSGQRYETFEEIEQKLHSKEIKLGVRRGEETHEVALTKDLVPGYDTDNDQAKSEMKDFMSKDFPDLTAEVKFSVAEDDKVVSLIEYRGFHARYHREAIWREALFVRFSEGRIVESWPIIDESSFFRHLGFQLIPPEA